jgi:hypothetical protein
MWGNLRSGAEESIKTNIAGVEIPDSLLALAACDHIRKMESVLLFHHAQRAFLFAALTGYRNSCAAIMSMNPP